VNGRRHAGGQGYIPTVLVEAWLPRAAAARPDRAAIDTPAGRLSYGELARASAAAAGALRAGGVGPGNRVALALPAGLELAITLHACLRLGAAVVPVDPRLSAGERELVLARADVVIEQPLDLATAPPDLPQTHDLDAVAAVIHTSGTSAAPRPVELTYGNWLWSALGAAVALGLDPAERWLCALPLAHVGGLSILLRSVIYGTTAVLHERFDTDRVLAELSDGEGATLVSLVPTTLSRLLDAGLARPPRLRCALLGGAPLPAALSQRARAAEVPVSHTYGLTEACSQVSTQPIGAGGAGPQATEDAGVPLVCTRVAVAPDGEILVAGPTVAPGSLAGDGWLHTGDLGQLEAGRLRVTGRKSNTIITGGENVAPEEVEAVLAAHPAVAEALVSGRQDSQWGEALVASVVLRDGLDVSPAELQEHCRRALAAFKVPKEITVSPEPLPRNRTGKLVRPARAQS